MPASRIELLRSDPAPAEISRADAARRTVDLVFLSGARIRRMDFMTGEPYFLEFVITPEAADLTRLNAGASVLDSHQQFSIEHVIGVVERAWVKAGKAYATVRFSDRADVEPIFLDVQNKIIRAVSAGVEILKDEWLPADERSEGLRIRLARRWSPVELSFVAVGSDAGALTLSAHALDSHQGANMPAREIPGGGAVELTIAHALEDLGPRARPLYDHLIQQGQISVEQLNALVVECDSLKDLRARVLERLSEMTDRRVSGSYINAELLGGAPGAQLEAMTEAASLRFGYRGELSEPAKQYAYLKPHEFARICLERRHVATRGLSPSRLVSLAMNTTSDFPELWGNALNRTLRQAYQSYSGGLREISRRVSAADFRPLHRIQLGNYPSLEKVNEGGEFKYGTFAESKETYKVETYGRILPISRQALINDDLDGVGRLAQTIARTAAEREASLFVALFAENSYFGPTMSDTKALFHTDHGNTGSGAIDVTNVGAGVAKLRLMKNLDGKTPINATPKFLIVPAAQETKARQLVAQITPAQISNVNPFSGLTVVVEPRLDVLSTTVWFLAADPALIDTLEHAYLEGQEGLYTEQRMGFEVDGIEIKARLDVGVGAIDYRGLYRSTGS